MLILIAGITGNVGQHAARHALDTGHTVRGLGRNPSKLADDIRSCLESFVQSDAYYDVPALDQACKGVDAVICAYSGLPELHLQGQLLLLEAAERAGITRFLAGSWNYDWRRIPFKSEPVYDAARMFHDQAELTSRIRPLHIFSGMLADVFFGPYFTPENHGVWDGAHKSDGTKSMEIFGTGDEVWQFTIEKDAGAYGVEVVTGPDAEMGGFVSVCSFETTMNGLRECYESVRGTTVTVKRMGSADVLLESAKPIQQKLGRRGFWEWHTYVFHANCVKGVWNMAELENDKFPGVKPQSLRQFLEEHPEI